MTPDQRPDQRSQSACERYKNLYIYDAAGGVIGFTLDTESGSISGSRTAGGSGMRGKAKVPVTWTPTRIQFETMWTKAEDL